MQGLIRYFLLHTPFSCTPLCKGGAQSLSFTKLPVGPLSPKTFLLKNTAGTDTPGSSGDIGRAGPFPIVGNLSLLFCLFLSLAITAGLSVQAGAHSGDRVYPIPELTDEMIAQIRLDDGSVDEWYDLVGEPTLTLLDFHFPYNNRLPDPSNLDFRIWLGWHDDPDRLYVAFVGSDDLYRNNHDYDSDDYHQSSIIFSQDSIVLAIDGDHSGGGGGGQQYSC